MAWQIVNWQDNYEDVRSMRLRNPQWVRVSNDTSSSGYITLTNHKDGTAHLGAWRALQGLASRSANHDGLIPYGIPMISAKTRLPIAVFEKAIPRLCDIGWLEPILDPSDILGPNGTEPVRAGPDGSLKGREGKGIEGKGTPPAAWTPALKKAWKDWVTFRKQNKATLTELTIERQIKKLTEMGNDRAIAAIEHTIWKGWTGLREPDEKDGNGQLTQEAPFEPGKVTVEHYEGSE